MKNKKNLYEVLNISNRASLQEIKQAYQQLTESIKQKSSIIGMAEAELQQKSVDMAYEVLSVQHSRDAYDAKLLAEKQPHYHEEQADVVVAINDKRKSAKGKALTVIASVLVIWLVLQVISTIMFYRNTQSFVKSPEVVYEQQEKMRLQEFYQEYGVRADSIEEADAIAAQRRQEERDNREKERLQSKQEREYERWLSEGERISQKQSRERERAEEELASELSRYDSNSDYESDQTERERRREANKQRRKLGLKPIY